MDEIHCRPDGWTNEHDTYAYETRHLHDKKNLKNFGCGDRRHHGEVKENSQTIRSITSLSKVMHKNYPRTNKRTTLRELNMRAVHKTNLTRLLRDDEIMPSVKFLNWPF